MKNYLIILIAAVTILFVGCQSDEPNLYNGEAELDYAGIIAELEAENERLRELLAETGQREGC